MQLQQDFRDNQLPEKRNKTVKFEDNPTKLLQLTIKARIVTSSSIQPEFLQTQNPTRKFQNIAHKESNC